MWWNYTITFQLKEFIWIKKSYWSLWNSFWGNDRSLLCLFWWCFIYLISHFDEDVFWISAWLWRLTAGKHICLFLLTCVLFLEQTCPLDGKKATLLKAHVALSSKFTGLPPHTPTVTPKPTCESQPKAQPLSGSPGMSAYLYTNKISVDFRNSCSNCMESWLKCSFIICVRVIVEPLLTVYVPQKSTAKVNDYLGILSK